MGSNIDISVFLMTAFIGIIDFILPQTFTIRTSFLTDLKSIVCIWLFSSIFAFLKKLLIIFIWRFPEMLWMYIFMKKQQ